MIDMRSARRQAYRYGRQVSQLDQDDRWYVATAYERFRGQFASVDLSGDLGRYLDTSYRAGSDGDSVTDEAYGYLV